MHSVHTWTLLHPSPVLAPVLGPLPLQGQQLALELLPHPHLDTAAVTPQRCISITILLHLHVWVCLARPRPPQRVPDYGGGHQSRVARVHGPEPAARAVQLARVVLVL